MGKWLLAGHATKRLNGSSCINQITRNVQDLLNLRSIKKNLDELEKEKNEWQAMQDNVFWTPEQNGNVGFGRSNAKKRKNGEIQ